MKLALRLLTLALSLSALSAAAQPGVGFGDDPNSWRGRPHGFRFDRDNTFGWAMMSQRERLEHRKKLMAVTSYNDCKAYMAEHHQQMQERAAEQGKSLPAAPSDVCDQMKGPVSSTNSGPLTKRLMSSFEVFRARARLVWQE